MSRTTLSLPLVVSAALLVAARWETKVVTPGSPDVTTNHVRDESHRYRTFTRSASGDTTEHEIKGSSGLEQHLTTYNGKPAILLVSIFEGPTSKFLDSALVMRAGLAPVWEHATSSRSTTQWEYAGNRVKQTVLAPDSLAGTKEHTYDIPVFHFNELEVLLRSLPLRAGYEAILPLYSEGSDELEMDSVRVMSKSSTGVWSVRFADPAIVQIYGIDGKTRQVVSRETTGRKAQGTGRRVEIR